MFVDDGVEFLFSAVVTLSKHRKKNFERFDTVDGKVCAPRIDGFISCDDGKVQRRIEDMSEEKSRNYTIQTSLAKLQLLLSSDDASVAGRVWVCHGPPYNTIGDLTHRHERVGSRALRDFISKEQPDVTLHAHLHESVEMHGKNNICTSKIGGETIVASCGNDFERDKCHGIVFDVRDVQKTLRRYAISVKEKPKIGESLNHSCDEQQQQQLQKKSALNLLSPRNNNQ